jgi:hypothetical protein
VTHRRRDSAYLAWAMQATVRGRHVLAIFGRGAIRGNIVVLGVQGENTTRKCAVDGLQQHYNFCIRRVLSGYALLQYEACERKLKRSSNGNKLN